MNHIHKMIIAYDIFFSWHYRGNVCRLQSCSGNEVYFYNIRLCLVFIFILVLPRFFLTLLHVKGFWRYKYLAVHFSIAKGLIFSCWIQNFTRFETPVLKPVNFLPGLKQLQCLGIQPDKMKVFYSFYAVCTTWVLRCQVQLKIN